MHAAYHMDFGRRDIACFEVGSEQIASSAFPVGNRMDSRHRDSARFEADVTHCVSSIGFGFVDALI